MRLLNFDLISASDSQDAAFGKEFEYIHP